MIQSTTPTSYIGAYRIERQLGRGAFGVVYQAYQAFLDRQVAIKTLRADLTVSAALEQQFMQEARTIARLRHPNIVTVYEFGTVTLLDKPYTYMVTEYLPGITLQELLQRGALSAADVVKIIHQLAQALDYAHSHNVIHRDLKPANIMFDAQGRPVIVDFGLAKLMQLSGGSASAQAPVAQRIIGNVVPMPELLSQQDIDAVLDRLYATITPVSDTKSIMGGTPAYMAPEQIIGRPASPASDQYALALITYEMLTGRSPFNGDDVAARLRARFTDQPLSLNAAGQSFPPEADAVMLRALRPDPLERYPQVEDFVFKLTETLLPDQPMSRVVVISDPVQAEQLRLAQQTVLGFMWGLVVVTLVVILFSVTEFLRGYINGDTPFIWDGILVSAPNSTEHQVIGMWPGSPAERGGIQLGDFLTGDILNNREDKSADFKVNGLPRSTYPVNWQYQAGDQIERTVIRAGRPVVVKYTLERSTFQVLVFFAHTPAALLAFALAIWLLLRWKAENRLQIFVVMLLAASFAMIASGVSNILFDLDAFASYMILALTLHFVLVFPEPSRFVPPKHLWWFYLPTIIGLVEFTIRRDIIVEGIYLDMVSFVFFALAIAIAVFAKWIRHELKYYPDLWFMIAMIVAVGMAAVGATIIYGLNDYSVVKALWGDGVTLYSAYYGVVVLGSSVALVVGTIGVHRIQLQHGPTWIAQHTDSKRPLAA